MRHIRTARWLVLPTVAFVLACSSDRVTGPAKEAVPVESGKADLWANDWCIFNAAWSCHGQPVLWWYFSSATVPYGDQYLDCPDGCTTYPLGAGTRRKVKNIIDNHIKSDASCSWAKSFLRTSYNYNRIRWYDTDDGNWGDAHSSSTSPINSDIHVWSGTFASTEELGKTLIHEAGHIHFDTFDETSVENWANRCYKP